MSMLLTTVILAACLGITHTTARAVKAADEAENDYPLWYDNYLRTEEDILSPGGTVELQIKSAGSVTGISILAKPEVPGAGSYTLKLRIYKWQKNILETLKGTPVAEKLSEPYTITEDEEPEYREIYVDLTGSPAGPGELVYSFELIAEAPVRLIRRLPAPMGIRYYEGGKGRYGSVEGHITFAETSAKPFEVISPNEDLVYANPPAEPTLDPQGAIATKNVDSTKWGAVDGLGRTLPSASKVGDKKDKLVGIFYWTWHWANSGGTVGPRNINNILEEYPESVNDYNHPIWTQLGGANFWNEPLFGYYYEKDDYVLRKHAELLADAGIDFVLFDCTNGDLTWKDAYMNLLKVWSQAREDGVNTPKIGFMMQFGYSGNTRSSLWQVYDTIYRDGLYKDLWFFWEGKPRVMAWDTGLDPNIAEELELSQFFTFRHPVASYWGDDLSDQYWGWLSAYPQALYRNDDGSVEYVTVGIAMNANYETQSLSAMNSGKNMGRSYAAEPGYSYSYNYRGRKIVVDDKIEHSKLYGRNFQEQWDYAISVDSEIVFVTGWNEWIMGRYEEWCGVENAFPDQCNDENSRDIEPSKGDLKDYYYYQLVANVRRFKGASEPDVQPKQVTIDIDGAITQWNDPDIVNYNHYAHNTLERDCEGFGSHYYTGDAARNDFTCAKVSYDKNKIWFYVETLDDITPYTDPNWMRLLIDAGAATASSKDWEEFEYIIGREGTTADTMRVERSTGGWNWETVGNAKYKVSGNVLVLELDRKLLGKAGKSLDFGFKWCDNNIFDGDILTLYTDGDAAPGGRFTFRFMTKPERKTPQLAWIIAGIAAAAVIALALIAVIAVNKKKKSNTAAAKALLLALICAIAVSSLTGLTACSGQNFFNAPPKPKTFSASGMSIVLTDRFVEEAPDGPDFTAYAENVAVSALKESFTLADGLADMSLDEYADIVCKNNGLSDKDILSGEAVRFFEYDSDADGKTFHYWVYLFKGSDAFWIFNFVSLKKDAPSLSSSVSEWAESVKV